MFRALPPTLPRGWLSGPQVVVVGREAQIVDEEDELQWIRGQLVHQIGDLIELVLLDFHEAQASAANSLAMALTVLDLPVPASP